MDVVFPLVGFADGRYRVDAEALEFLRGLKKRVSVVACAGKFRTGKSVLLNCLCDAADCFAVGDTTLACTKGVWLRKVPLHEDDERVLLLLDTEGIDSLGDQSSNEHDVRVFTLALLLSSAFLYNSVGAIDEGQVGTLSLMTKVSECVRMQAAAGGDAADDADAGSIADAMPAFYWILRDFSLQMASRDGEECSAERYMEEALASAPTSGGERNRTRAAIRGAFPTRQAVPLCRPTLGDSTARLGPHNVSRKFRLAVDALRRQLIAEVRPVRAHGVDLSGAAYARTVEAYVDALNAPGAVPVIKDVWSLATEVQARDTYDDILDAARKEAVLLAQAHRHPDELEAALDASAESAHVRFQAAVIESCPALADKLADSLRRLAAEQVAACRERIDEHIARHVAELDVAASEAPTLGGLLERVVAADRAVVPLLTSTSERTPRAANGGPDARALHAWRSHCFTRLVGTWLNDRVAALAATAADQQAGVDEAEAGRQAATERADALERRLRTAEREQIEAQGSVAALEARVATADAHAEATESLLRDERQRAAELQDKLVRASVPPPPASPSDTGAQPAWLSEAEAEAEAKAEAEEEAGAGGAAPGAARLDAMRIELEQAREGLLELRAVRETLLRENDELRHDQARVASEWSARLAALQDKHKEACARLRGAAADSLEKSAAELSVAAQREAEVRRALADAERREARVQASLTALEAGYTRELRSEKEASLAARGLAEDLQVRMLSMHAATLEDLRKRDATARERLQQMLAEKVELEVGRASAQSGMDHARAEANELKRKLRVRDDAEREAKRVREEAADERAKRENVDREVVRLRTRCEDAIVQREEAVKRANQAEREHAAVERELLLFRAERPE